MGDPAWDSIRLEQIENLVGQITVQTGMTEENAVACVVVVQRVSFWQVP